MSINNDLGEELYNIAQTLRDVPTTPGELVLANDHAGYGIMIGILIDWDPAGLPVVYHKTPNNEWELSRFHRDCVWSVDLEQWAIRRKDG